MLDIYNINVKPYCSLKNFLIREAAYNFLEPGVSAYVIHVGVVIQPFPVD